MAIRQTKTSGIDTLMQEIEAQAAGQQETIVTTEQIEALKQLSDTLAESIAELKDAKYRVDDAREVCEDIYKRLWGICDGVHAALLRAENTRIKAHIDEKEVQKLTQFAESLRAAEGQLLEHHLEKQKELWNTSLACQRRNLESNEGIWLSKKTSTPGSGSSSCRSATPLSRSATIWRCCFDKNNTLVLSGKLWR